MSVARHLYAVGISFACLAVPASPALAGGRPADGCSLYVAEAATRSGMPLDMIMRVMLAESGGDRQALSTKGAMGCMQIMPATWATLTMRYGLEPDPFDARMNMIGGALYLAELRGRFGIPGAYAAYNAGPNRYTRFAADGVPLPAETVAYATRLGGAGAPLVKANVQARWQEAALFVARANSVAKSAATPPSTAVETNDVGDGGAAPPGEPTPVTRGDPMFPLAVRNVALRR